MAEIYSSSPIYNIGSEEIIYQTTGDNGPKFNGKYRIRYFDADGTVLKIEYLSEGATLTPPENPSFDPEYLIFYGWNYDVNNLQVEGPMDIGALYNTVNDCFYLWIDLNATDVDRNERTSLTINLPIDPKNGSYDVDFGDGYIATGVYNFNHTYASKNKYLIKVTPNQSYTGYHNTTANRFDYSLTKAYIPSNTYFHPFYGLFSSCCNLKLVTLPATYTSPEANGMSLQSLFYKCYSLKYVTIPPVFSVGGTSAFDTTYSLKNISLPLNITSIEKYQFKSSSIESLIIPKNVITIDSYAFNNSKISEIYFNTKKLSGNILRDTFRNAYGLRNLIIPEGITGYEYYYALLYGQMNFNTLSLPTTWTSINDLKELVGTSSGPYLVNLILNSPTVVSLAVASNPYFIQYIWVPDNLLDAYKTDAVWSTVSGITQRLRPLSQYEGDY